MAGCHLAMSGDTGEATSQALPRRCALPSNADIGAVRSRGVCQDVAATLTAAARRCGKSEGYPPRGTVDPPECLAHVATQQLMDRPVQVGRRSRAALTEAK